MLGIARRKSAVMWTVLLIATVQMPHLGLSSGTNSIKEFFALPDATVQVAVALPALLSTVAGFISALLIRYRLVTKKAAAVAGVFLVGLTGVAAVAFHSSFWQVYLYSILIGAGMGAYIPNAQGIAIDVFDEREFQIIAGMQSSFVNCGGIVLSLAGGFLISRTGRWYSAYATLLVTLPIAFIALKNLPGEERRASGHGAPTGGAASPRPTKLDRGVYRYTLGIFVFMALYCVLSGNIAIHISNYGAGDAGMAGIALALAMGGGAAAGLVFSKLSSALRDNMAPLAHIELFISYMLLGIFPESGAVILIASFIGGLSLSTMVPHCIFSVSALVDPTNSSTASMLTGTLAPGTGSFLSPIIITNVTRLLFGDSTAARFVFAAVVSAAVAVALFADNARRAAKRKRAGA
jgi:MFS family permease